MADAGRVIAGTARGHPARGARADATRPLGDRVKQTLFAILEPDLRGARVLDLFAGTGAAGIEALSRGAAHATFVERDTGGGRGHRHEPRPDAPRRRAGADRPRRGRRLAGAARRPAAAGPFDVVIVDPPYAEPELLAAALEALGPHLAPGARVVAKHFWRDPPPASVGLLASERERRFGETTLTFYRRAGGSMNTVAVYPGSFDPITNGHLDIIGPRGGGLRHGDRRVLANPRKAPLLDVETRIRVIRDGPGATPAHPADRIEVEAFDGLTVDLCRARGADFDRPRPARDQRLRDRDAARPQQPGPGAATSTRSSS